MGRAIDPRDVWEREAARVPTPAPPTARKEGRWRRRPSPWGEVGTIGEEFARDAEQGKRTAIRLAARIGTPVAAVGTVFAMRLDPWIFGLLGAALAALLLVAFGRRVRRLRRAGPRIEGTGGAGGAVSGPPRPART